MNRKRLFNIAKLLIVIYCVIGIAVYYLQDQLLFHPQKKYRTEKFDIALPHRDVNIPFNDTANMNVVQFSTAGAASIKGVVLYFHGNRKNIEWYAKYAPNFTRHGYEVWMLDYPGFGKSTGALTEERLYDYAAQLYKLARARFPKDSIIIYGKSMGTGIAAQLASTKDCRALILETPYYSIRSLFARYLFLYPLHNMIRFHLPSYQYLPKVDAPITIFHGTADGVIPYSNAQKLQPLLKAKDRFITIEGGEHNNLAEYPLFRKELDALLEK